MDISMPSDFPMADFRAFGLATQKFFPKLLSDEDLKRSAGKTATLSMVMAGCTLPIQALLRFQRRIQRSAR
jgi:hypothetical protein